LAEYLDVGIGGIGHGCGDATTTVPIIRYRPELSIFTSSPPVAQWGNIACGIT